MDWYDIGVGLFLLGLIASGCGLAFIATSDISFGRLMYLLTVLTLTTGSGIVLMQVNEKPSSVEQLDNTKCSMYVWNGKWDCVPWDQAG